MNQPGPPPESAARPAQGRPVEDVSSPRGDEGQVLPLFRSMVAPDGPLHWVARFTRSCLDCVVEATADPALSPTEVAGRPEDTAIGGLLSARVDPEPEQGRAVLEQIGQQLGLTAGYLDRRLSGLRSGRIIRLVVQSDRGAFLCNSVVPDQYIAGGVLVAEPAPAGPPVVRHPRIDEADQRLSTAATNLRGLASQGDQSPGGFRFREDAIPTDEPSQPPVLMGRPDHPLAALCQAAVTPHGLHYCAFHQADGSRVSADILGDELLTQFFAVIRPAERRRFYQGFEPEFAAVVGELCRTVSPVIGPPLNRVVLDVEQGALYFNRLGHGTYLIGVTVNQWRVNQADDRISDLAARFHASLSGESGPAADPIW
ncbi:MAG: hypothetical protein JXA67_17785 [Micromonosporaceae bacterium]|nr:hypothetical protein [Micromonosporaceae bacterium]